MHQQLDLWGKYIYTFLEQGENRIIITIDIIDMKINKMTKCKAILWKHENLQKHSFF